MSLEMLGLTKFYLFIYLFTYLLLLFIIIFINYNNRIK